MCNVTAGCVQLQHIHPSNSVAQLADTVKVSASANPDPHPGKQSLTSWLRKVPKAAC